MKSPQLPSIFSCLALALLVVQSSNAAIIVTLPTPMTLGSIQITQDIHFTITTAGSSKVMGLAFDEWVVSDGAANILPGVFSPFSLDYKLNGGATQTNSIEGLIDNEFLFYGVTTANDGVLSFGFTSGLLVEQNDVVTLLAGTYSSSLGDPVGFNPQANQEFTGNAFLVDYERGVLTANTPVVPVPEPSATMLLLSTLGVALRHRRRASVELTK